MVVFFPNGVAFTSHVILPGHRGSPHVRGLLTSLAAVPHGQVDAPTGAAARDCDAPSTPRIRGDVECVGAKLWVWGPLPPRLGWVHASVWCVCSMMNSLGDSSSGGIIRWARRCIVCFLALHHTSLTQNYYQSLVPEPANQPRLSQRHYTTTHKKSQSAREGFPKLNRADPGDLT